MPHPFPACCRSRSHHWRPQSRSFDKRLASRTGRAVRQIARPASPRDEPVAPSRRTRRAAVHAPKTGWRNDSLNVEQFCIFGAKKPQVDLIASGKARIDAHEHGRVNSLWMRCRPRSQLSPCLATHCYVGACIRVYSGHVGKWVEPCLDGALEGRRVATVSRSRLHEAAMPISLVYPRLWFTRVACSRFALPSAVGRPHETWKEMLLEIEPR